MTIGAGPVNKVGEKFDEFVKKKANYLLSFFIFFPYFFQGSNIYVIQVAFFFFMAYNTKSKFLLLGENMRGWQITKPGELNEFSMEEIIENG